MARLLDQINSASDLKSGVQSKIRRLAAEIREDLVSVIPTDDGHLTSSLRVVKLTMVLLRVFDSPQDKIVQYNGGVHQHNRIQLLIQSHGG